MDKLYKVMTYGCQMNVHESEKIAGILEELGYKEAGDTIPDIYVFNTCCIRDTAEKHIFGNLGVVKTEKKNKKDMIVAVVGCMTQQAGYDALLKQKYPYVDIVLGTRNLDQLKEAIFNVLESRKKEKKYKYMSQEMVQDYLETDDKIPVTRTSYPNAWVNIIYGCNNFCTYCIVPYVRGRELSRPMDAIVDEVRRCLDEGYKEITLLGQNVNSYGNDLKDGHTNFANLLKEVGTLDYDFRLRFMTNHPKDLTEDVVEAMASSKRICNNIHLPVQSGSNKVLKDMNRHYTREKYFSLIEMLRKAMPDIGITSDIMVGFPTETEEDFKDTMDLVEQVRYSNAFTFIYSPRQGTPAAAMEQIPYEIKKRRIGELIKLQNKITKELSNDYVGNVYRVLAEDVAPKLEGMVCGRTESGRLVNFGGTKEDVGTFFNVRIEQSKSASLFGKKE
ncbi:MAG: tRNA (N6-isopentenyl adenosine(37)-C2)-methylthiotransferase MiaB [Clostridia bacterium]|nr:tRNA (N6-isopentenyl adenosine(37)-C2)-methylthiotransferase MiaB [Clostridia bacterium]